MYLKALLLFLLCHSIHSSHSMQSSSFNETSEETSQGIIRSSEQTTFSISVLNSYAQDQSWPDPQKTAVSLLSDTNTPIQEVVEAWKPLHTKTYMHKYQNQANFLSVCREILLTENQPYPLTSYHGYGTEQALLYDIYTTIATVLDNAPAQPRSRFRFNSDPDISLYETALDLPSYLMNNYGTIWNDHLDDFKMHGISSAPHLFSNSHEMGESPLQALLGIYNHSSSDTLNNLIKDIGFKDINKYLDLIPSYLKDAQQDGGFITRFSFRDSDIMDIAAYPSPISKSGYYGQPCRMRIGDRIGYGSCSTVLPILKEQKLYGMQLRQVYIPAIYTNGEAVTTQNFSLIDLPNQEEYTSLLTSYIKEDLKDRSSLQNQQMQYWLQSR